MTKRTTLMFLAAGLVSFLALGNSRTAEADQRGRQGRFEQPGRQDFRPGVSRNRREVARPRTDVHRDVRGNHGRYDPPRRPAARQEIRENWREIQKDRAELRRDLRDYQGDRAALQRAYRRGASPAEIARLRGELRESAGEVRESRQELRQDYAELRRDRDRFGHGGRYDNRGNWNRNDQGWWGWGNGPWNNPRDRWGFDYGRD
jgi:hypothetical protein